MVYLLDSSTLIDAKNDYYRFGVCQGFWDALLSLNQKQVVCSIDKIRDELLRGRDDLADWARQDGNALFRPSDEETHDCYKLVSEWVWRHPDFTDAAKRQFLDCADPWLVAYAMAHQCAIVTHERYNRNRKSKVAIQAPCEQFGVDVVDLFDLLHQQGIRLVLGDQEPPELSEP